MVANGGIVEKVDEQEVKLANDLDGQIRHEWKASERSIERLGGLLSKMREGKYWIHLVNPETKEPFKRFEEYVCAVTGDRIAHTKLYDMLAIHGLTRGPSAISQKDIDEMGPTKAAEVARLESADRTPEIVEAAKKESFRKVKKMVQAKLNEKLPPEKQKEPTFMFARNLDEPTIDLIEQVELDGIWMDICRDGDGSVSQLVKLWNYVWARFVLDHQEELAEGRKYREAMEAAKVAAITADDVEEETSPPEPEEHEAELHASAHE